MWPKTPMSGSLVARVSVLAIVCIGWYVTHSHSPEPDIPLTSLPASRPRPLDTTSSLVPSEPADDNATRLHDLQLQVAALQARFQAMEAQMTSVLERYPRALQDALPASPPRPSITDTQHVSTAPANTTPSGPVESYSLKPPRWRAQPPDTGKFLFGCIVRGRHHNQLITWGKMYAIARQTGRTLVMPNFVQAPNGPSEGAKILRQDLRVMPAELLYDYEALNSGPVRVITQTEFFRSGKPLTAACMDFSGCSPAPRLLMCASQITNYLTCQEPILALGSWVFGHIASPPFDEDCFWPLLRPSAAFRPALNHVHSLLPPKYLALHQRTFGDNCIIILKVFWEKYYKRVPASQRLHDAPMSLEECRMRPAYVEGFRNGSTDKFYVGTDNYHPAWTQRLLSIGGITYHAKGFGEPISVIADMLLDMWIFVDAEVFLGNPLSTLSYNVCSIRWAAGKSCPNMPRPDNTKHCFVYDLMQ
uniref:O-fucosyltransferase family protein n=1 Tax=Eutreptiella gymnastica TaxID=73025 RepID=A0A7S4FHD8_9EUGL